MATPVFVEEDSRPVRKQTGPPPASQNLEESLREKPPLDGNVPLGHIQTMLCLFTWSIRTGTNAKGLHHHSQPGPAYSPSAFSLSQSRPHHSPTGPADHPSSWACQQSYGL